MYDTNGLSLLSQKYVIDTNGLEVSTIQMFNFHDMILMGFVGAC